MGLFMAALGMRLRFDIVVKDGCTPHTIVVGRMASPQVFSDFLYCSEEVEKAASVFGRAIGPEWAREHFSVYVEGSDM